MSDILSIFKSVKGNRDPVFKMALDLLDGKPANILEIGCTRNFSRENRRSDGWSTIHFLSYLRENGGQLSICDIDKTSLDILEEILSKEPEFKDIQKRFLLGDGRDFIDLAYDLIYLDGGDDPKEMVEELKRVNFARSIVLCDDFHTKGSLAKSIFPSHALIKWPEHSHEMAIYSPLLGIRTIFCEIIEEFP